LASCVSYRNGTCHRLARRKSRRVIHRIVKVGSNNVEEDKCKNKNKKGKGKLSDA
jgi:hypothetical protein